MAKNYSFTVKLQNGKQLSGVCHVDAKENALDKIRSFAESLYGQKAMVTSVD